MRIPREIMGALSKPICKSTQIIYSYRLQNESLLAKPRPINTKVFIRNMENSTSFFKYDGEGDFWCRTASQGAKYKKSRDLAESSFKIPVFQNLRR